MKFSAGTVAALLLLSSSSSTSVVTAFSVGNPHSARCNNNNKYKSSRNGFRSDKFTTAAVAALKSGASDLHEFDYLLREINDASELQQHQQQLQQHQQQQQSLVSRRRIALTDERGQTVILASSTTAETTSTRAVEEEFLDGGDEQAFSDDAAASANSAEESTEYDPYGVPIDRRMNKIQQYQEQRSESTVKGLEARLKQMDLQDIVATLILPAIALFAAGRWAFNRVSTKVGDKADVTLEAFAKELIYHDGDFDEMKLCYQDYSRRLVWIGPKRTDAMLKRYLAAYAKKKTVSPQAISSLSYVFTLFSLSEEQAARILVSLCRDLGAEKISSAGKLLFLGSRIFKSPEGKAALLPIKDLIKSTYRDATVADSLVETSQQAIAEASYRTAVQAAGKDQKTLTPGWEVLGLDKEAAQRIWSEEAKEGFVSARVTMYGGQTTKYDKKGRIIDDKGKLVNPEEADEDDDKAGGGDSQAVSNVYECSECGFTLFVATGRESKFFGTSFKCPECGASKDKFKAKDSMDD